MRPSFLTFVLDHWTMTERITTITRYAWTWWKVIHNLTYCILSTCSRTRIFTFAVQASQIWWTIRVQYTFWSASFIWISDIILNAWTWSSSVLFSAVGIWATWTWRTWIGWDNRIILFHFVTLPEWITRESLWTIAHWCMTDNSAFSIKSTHSRTWITALLIHTC